MNSSLPILLLGWSLSAALVLAVAVMLARRLSVGRREAFALGKALRRAPRAYLHDIHEVVIRERGAGPMHATVSLSVVTSVPLLGVAAIAPSVVTGYLLIACSAGLLAGGIQVARRRYPHRPTRLSGGMYQRLPGIITRPGPRAIRSPRPVLLFGPPTPQSASTTNCGSPRRHSGVADCARARLGNTVIVKPADLTPASVHSLAEILVECGCPDGVFNLVMGRGRTVGQALVDHPDVTAVSFTGSVEVGRRLIRSAAERQLKFQAEMGGKRHHRACRCDLEVAVHACINAALYSTGQRCTATERIIVEQSILAEFTQRFVHAARALKVGHALDPTTQVGPVVSEVQLEANLAYVRLAAEEGCPSGGGEPIQSGTRGYFQTPAVFLGATNNMHSSREEIVDPCASVIAATDFDEAISLLNDSPYGLSAGICTRSLKHSREFLRRCRTGLAMVDLPTAGVDYHVPFGGAKGASYGPREQGHQAIELFTTLKTAYTLA